MARVLIGLGSNLGERWSHLEGAVDALSTLDPLLVVSPVYETAPVGGPTDQGAFLNCVVELHSERSPDELLDFAHELEAAAKRVRRERNGPRTLDVDLLLIDGVARSDEHLTLPHPRMYERAFVLAPLEDLDPDLVPSHWREHLGGEEEVNAAVRRVGELANWPIARGGHGEDPSG